MMDLMNVVAFLGGCIVGAAGCFFVIRQIRSESNMERQMRELQDEFTAYRENVNQHFSQTATLVNNLTESYVSVQKHLKDAAESFSQPPKSFELEPEEKDKQLPQTKTEFISLEKKPEELEADDGEDAKFDESSSIEQPRDYAPKQGPGDKGTLSEDFGLHKKAGTH